MERLKQILKSVTPNLSEELLSAKFKEIASVLISEYAIENGDKCYLLKDLEFYYYSHLIDDKRADGSGKTVTYQRDCEAGKWFFHNSGMDLCFNSDSSKGYGGGILIREIADTATGRRIKGPQKVYTELFDYYVDALSPITYPYLKPIAGKLSGNTEAATRVNTDKIDAHRRRWRFKTKQ